MFDGFLANRRVQLGFAILGVFVFLALFGDLVLAVYGYGPFDVDYENLAAPPLTAGHLLGTTVSGQDVFSQLVAGSRGSITVGLMAAIIATVIGAAIGVTSGYFGGLVDLTLNAFTNIFITLPAFAITLIVGGYISAAGGAGGPGMGLIVMAILIGVFDWPGFARYLRSQTLSLRSRDFAMATRMIGERKSRLVFVEIMPHLNGILSAMFLATVVGAIFTEAALNFLGITTSGTISWGTMISNAQSQGAVIKGWWWWILTPGFCIALIGMATALINFGLDEVTNPRLRSANRKSLKQFERLRKDLARKQKLEDRKVVQP